MPFETRKTTNQVRSWESNIACPDWVKLLSDPEEFLVSTIHVTEVKKLNDTADESYFSVTQTQPLLLNMSTKITALTTLLAATAGITSPTQQGDIIRVQTFADLSTHTSSTWNVQSLASGCNVTEKYQFDTPWYTHAIVRAQVDQTHEAAFAHYQQWIVDHPQK